MANETALRGSSAASLSLLLAYPRAPTHPGKPPIEPPFSACAPANLLTSTHAHQATHAQNPHTLLRAPSFSQLSRCLEITASAVASTMPRAVHAQTHTRLSASCLQLADALSRWVLQVVKLCSPPRKAKAEKEPPKFVIKHNCLDCVERWGSKASENFHAQINPAFTLLSTPIFQHNNCYV